MKNSFLAQKMRNIDFCQFGRVIARVWQIDLDNFSLIKKISIKNIACSYYFREIVLSVSELLKLPGTIRKNPLKMLIFSNAWLKSRKKYIVFEIKISLFLFLYVILAINKDTQTYFSRFVGFKAVLSEPTMWKDDGYVVQVIFN